MSHIRLLRVLLAGGVVVIMGSATTRALASPAPRCTPTVLNRPATLPGTSLSVSPLPDTFAASPSTQISLLGVPPGALGSVRVSGSQTGPHAGSLRAYSQRDGASFVPSRPFAPGEVVTVRGKITSAGHSQPFQYHFMTAYEDVLPYVAPTAPAGYHPDEVQHFHSQPQLEPPVVDVTANSAQSAPGYLFAAPYSGEGSSGPMIFDEHGNLVWFDPLPSGVAATNLQVQQYFGTPVLTWWQGYIPPQGFGEGEEMIDNDAYQPIGRVHAGNGYKADLHEFHITPQGTALLTVFNPIFCDLSAVGGPSSAAVTDSVFQEIDLETGLVRREWHSVDHVPLSDSYSSPRESSAQWPFDYFHLNSIDQQPDGETLISARNTWGLYELNTTTGQVVTTIGGKHSEIQLAPGAAPAFQHDASALENGTISVFDNGATPKIHPQSRVLVLAVDSQTRTGTLVAQYEHPGALSAGSQGSVEPLPDGNLFVGWGEEPYFSEFSASGQLLFDAHMHGTYQSYRAYRFPWTGAPTGAPAIAASASGSGAPAADAMTVYVSWNGDTRTASWRLLTGPSPRALTPVGVAPRGGYETAIATHPAAYVAAQALDASGAVLAVSPTIRG